MVNIHDSSNGAGIFLYILFFIGFIYVQVRFSDSPYIKKNLKKYLILRNLDRVYKPFLSQYFPFYNALDSNGKLVFERRVQRFIDIKQFIPRGGIKVILPEMKVMIAGSAIQLTYGYPGVYFSHFWRILVYPDNYYSSITHRYHKGEVNIKGMIVLSWKSFKDGFSNPSDGKNLGFHEMAHALRLSKIVDNDEYDFYDQDKMDEFENEAHNETMKILNSPDGVSLFRHYCVVNMDEFFAVATECFFEKPVEFKNYNPKLYALLSEILRIDPIILFNSEESRTRAS